MATADLREDLSCPICLDIYTDPVSLGCGHHFCRVCIDRVLVTQDAFGLYICPECRVKFQERPVLSSARFLRNIVEKFLISQPVQEDTGVYCTYCVDSHVPALKSCQLCESCLCDKHLRVHTKSPLHVLSDLTNPLGDRKCLLHKKIVEYYCPRERVCICVHCKNFGLHRGHPVEKLSEAIEKKREKLRKDLEMLTSNKAWAEKQVRSLEEHKKDSEEKAVGVTERVSALLNDAMRRLAELAQRAPSGISRQQENISLSVSELIQKRKMQKHRMSRRISDIEELRNTADPMTILEDQNSDGEDIYDTEQEDTMAAIILSEGDFREDLVTDKIHKLFDCMKDIDACIWRPGVLLDEETAANNLYCPETSKRFKINLREIENFLQGGGPGMEGRVIPLDGELGFVIPVGAVMLPQ
ncbi:E3 ubiquitin-protein ligase TRIM41-like [Rana temporaria]|uniref:E3 ubiquitin-protein ligase TRIM41-like n=1 Tax=Rana temporaria TaxID=8407 RepID=UPI001AACE0BE|nr:E3 ubiquitin-protein ligase TRIM41-like [Rana temporaria]